MESNRRKLYLRDTAADSRLRDELANLRALAPTGIDSLSDVVLTAPVAGEVLKYDGSVWVNDVDGGGGGGSAPIYANAQRQALQSIAAGPWVLIQFDTEGADSGALFSLANPTYIEIPSDGAYVVSAHLPWKATPGSGSRGIVITKNGSPGSATLTGTYDNNTGNTQSQSCSWTGTLAAGDKLYLYAITTSADEVRVSSGNGACFLGVMGAPTGGSGDLTDGDKGDITVASSGGLWTIDAGAVSTSKMGGDVTAAGKALLDDADAAAQRTTLGLGTAATAASGDFAAASHTHSIANVTGLQTALDGKQPLATVLTNTTAAFTTAQETKLSGIATGATANAADSALRDRTTHTGTQAASTISDFSEAVDDRVAALLVAGTNVTLTYDDVANTLTVAATGGGGGGGLTQAQTLTISSLGF